MKTIGLLGGMSWESTALYYRLINQGVRERAGALHSARIAMLSVDFQEIETLQRDGDWGRAGALLARAAQNIEAAGADFLLIATNTMHIVADDIQAAVGIPLLHLADATADAIKAAGLARVGLLGTRFTMEEDFYRARLEQRHGLDVRVPEREARALVHRVIYDELCQGEVKDASRRDYLRIVRQLCDTGAEGVIAGCTEIGLLLEQRHLDVPLFDTTVIHAHAAVEAALA